MHVYNFKHVHMYMYVHAAVKRKYIHVHMYRHIYMYTHICIRVRPHVYPVDVDALHLMLVFFPPWMIVSLRARVQVCCTKAMPFSCRQWEIFGPPVAPPLGRLLPWSVRWPLQSYRC